MIKAENYGKITENSRNLPENSLNKAWFKTIANESKGQISLGWYPIDLDSRREPLGSSSLGLQVLKI